MRKENYSYHFDYIKLASDTGFTFDNYKYCHLGKNNNTGSLDIDRIIGTKDVATVEKNIPLVLQYVLEQEQIEILEKNFVKTFRLAQLAVEYLLFCKQYLDNTVTLLKNDVKKISDEKTELEQFNEQLQAHIDGLTEKVAFNCKKCSKKFVSTEFLNAHMQRRHDMSADSSRSDNNKANLEMEIKNLKHRLNCTEKLVNTEVIRKENATCQASDFEKEANEKQVQELKHQFEGLKNQVESEMKLLQSQKSSDEKYLKWFEIVSSKIEEKCTDNFKQLLCSVDTQTEKKRRSHSLTQTEDLKSPILARRNSTQTDSIDLKTSEIQTHDAQISPKKTQTKVIKKEQPKTRETKNEDASQIDRKIKQIEDSMNEKMTKTFEMMESQMSKFFAKYNQLDVSKSTPILKISPKDTPRNELNMTPQNVYNVKTFNKTEDKTLDFEESHEIIILKEPQDIETDDSTLSPPFLVKPKRRRSNLTNPSTSKITNKSDPSLKSEKTILSKKHISDSETEMEEIYKKLEVSYRKPQKRNKKVKKVRSEVSNTNTSTLGKRSITSLKKVAINDSLLNEFGKELDTILEARLTDLGISSEWKGIPIKTFERSMEILNHQATLTEKKYPNFQSLRQKLIKNIAKKIRMAKNSLGRNREKSQEKNIVTSSPIMPIKQKQKQKKIKPPSSMENKEPISKTTLVQVQSPKIEIKNRHIFETDSEDDLIVKSPEHNVFIPKTNSKTLPGISKSKSYTQVMQEFKEKTANLQKQFSETSVKSKKEQIVNKKDQVIADIHIEQTNDIQDGADQTKSADVNNLTEFDVSIDTDVTENKIDDVFLAKTEKQEHPSSSKGVLKSTKAAIPVFPKKKVLFAPSPIRSMHVIKDKDGNSTTSVASSVLDETHVSKGVKNDFKKGGDVEDLSDFDYSELQ